MDFGNGITTQGPVRCAQATQPGEAVTLGDDGHIPSELVPGGGRSV